MEADRHRRGFQVFVVVSGRCGNTKHGLAGGCMRLRLITTRGILSMPRLNLPVSKAVVAKTRLQCLLIARHSFFVISFDRGQEVYHIVQIALSLPGNTHHTLSHASVFSWPGASFLCPLTIASSSAHTNSRFEASVSKLLTAQYTERTGESRLLRCSFPGKPSSVR